MLETDNPLTDRDSLAGSNLLVTGPPMAGKCQFVVENLAEAADPVFVTTTRNATKQLEGADLSADSVQVVDCSPGATDTPEVENVGSPGDLTGISMPVSEFLDEAERPVVAVDSISSLLMYADEAPLFRFLSVLTGRISNAGGLGLYTLDAGCHEQEVIATLGQLFDGRIELGEDGVSTTGLPEADPIPTPK